MQKTLVRGEALLTVPPATETFFDLEWLKTLLATRALTSIIDDDGNTLLCETSQEGRHVSLFPFAKILSQEEVSSLRLGGKAPTT